MRSTMKCIDNKREIMEHKKYYAKLFSEGRESLEKMLLAAYDNGTMTRACCAGHIDNKITSSYIYFRSQKKDLKLLSSISKRINNSGLKDYCMTTEEIKLGLRDLNKYFLGVHIDYDKADLVFETITELIKNKEQDDSLEYETIIALKECLLNLRRNLLSEYLTGWPDVSSIEIRRIKNDIFNSGISTGKHLHIFGRHQENDFYVAEMEDLTRRIYDRKVNLPDLIGTYVYEDDKELKELQKALKR